MVLDEADQMLDMGFEEDMEVILQQVGAPAGAAGQHCQAAATAAGLVLG